MENVQKLINLKGRFESYALIKKMAVAKDFCLLGEINQGRKQPVFTIADVVAQNKARDNFRVKWLREMEKALMPGSLRKPEPKTKEERYLNERRTV